MAMTAWGLCPVKTEGVIWKRPACKMPSPRLAVRATDFFSIFCHQRAHRNVTIHGLQHFKAGTIQSDEGKIVVQWGEPPFVRTVLIGDEIGDVPGKETEDFPGQATRFVKGNGRFHAA